MDGKERILPQIDQALCNNCGICVVICPANAVALVDGWPVIARPKDCAYCGDCEELCPQNAISLPYEILFAE